MRDTVSLPCSLNVRDLVSKFRCARPDISRPRAGRLQIKFSIDLSLKDVAANRLERDAACMVARIGQMPAVVVRTDLIASAPRPLAEEMAKNFDIEIHPPPIPVASSTST